MRSHRNRLRLIFSPTAGGGLTGCATRLACRCEQRHGSRAHLARGGARAHFSVRDAISERPVATLSLIWIDDYWHIDQLKGLRNAEVAIHQAIYFDGEETVIDIEMTELYFAAQELPLRYRRAWAVEQH